MSRKFRFVLTDVFTGVPYAGNQLGVFTNATGLSDDEMQMLALELNFSETTFVLPPEGGGDIRMRIFTPTCELPFAGHPTLGTAFVVGGPLQRVLLKIETGAGIVPVMLEREGAKIVFGRMEQPIPTVLPVGDVAPLLAALGVSESALPVGRYDNGIMHLMVPLHSADEVAALQPDAKALRAASGAAATVSCFAADGATVKTRVFAPDVGVFEDPATGSAAGPLAVHLALHGVVSWGTQVEISQGAEIGRPSTLYATAEGGPEAITRVEVGGTAVSVAQGEFTL